MATGLVETSTLAIGWVIEKVCDEAGSRITEHVLRRILERRAQAAREIALEEIKAGHANILLAAPAADELIAIMWRYLRSAEEGAARLNLRLMASVLSGQINSGALFASEFLRWAGLLESLAEDEVNLLAVLHRQCMSENASNADAEARRLLIPKICANNDEYVIVGQSLMRTGLVQETAMGWWDGGSNGFDYCFKTTSRMARLAKMADLEGVLHRES